MGQSRNLRQVRRSISAAIGAAKGRYPAVISIEVEDAVVFPACVRLAPGVLLLPMLLLLLIGGVLLFLFDGGLRRLGLRRSDGQSGNEEAAQNHANQQMSHSHDLHPAQSLVGHLSRKASG